MNKILVVFMLIAMLLLNGCNLLVPANRYETLQKTYDDERLRTEQLEKDLNELREKYTELEGNVAQSNVDAPIDPYDEKILGSLFLRPDLIPVGGEDMRYYTDLCRVLNETYTYAYAEDGRNMADMILSYKLREDATYSWNLEIYNIGDGWQIADGTSEMDVPESSTEPPENASSVSSSASSSASTASSIAAPTPPPSSLPSESSSSATASKPAVSKPIPNEAQQQKFREIASIIK